MPSSQSLGSGAQGPALAVEFKHGRARTPKPPGWRRSLGAREGSLRPETTDGGTRRQRRKAKGHRLREEAPPSRAGLRCVLAPSVRDAHAERAPTEVAAWPPVAAARLPAVDGLRVALHGHLVRLVVLLAAGSTRRHAASLPERRRGGVTRGSA